MTDSELARALQRGDREVFGDLVDHYRDMVFGLCRRITGNERDADELAHDTFVEAYLKIATLREPEKLAGWLRTIALNLARQWCRRRRQAWAQLPDEVAAAEPDAEDPALLARMSAGLGELPAPQRLVLVLHYFERMSYEQTADFLGVPIGTIMSRLHRARRALREILETPCPDEDVPMSDSDRFKQEIQAEIAVLLEMFGQDRGAAERLTVILQHSPQRFGQLLAEAQDEALRANLATLLPRLGAGAMQAALDVALSPDAQAAGRASDVLQRFLRSYRPSGRSGWDVNTPGHATYTLMDRLIHHAAEPAAKADLLLDLLDACEDDGPFSAAAALVTNVLLCYPQPSLDRLVEWFRGTAGKDDLYDSAWRLFALCRTGTPFCKEIAQHLASPDAVRQIVGLAGAEALGRCLDLSWLEEATPAAFALDVRFRAKWPPLRRQNIEPHVLADMAERAANLLDHPQAEIRNGALAALGRLRAGEHVKRILPHAVHEDASTRLAAIRALAETGDATASGVLMHIARGPDSPGVRRAAVEALGRLQVQESEGLLAKLLQDPDPQVQEAAAAGLAGLDTPAARAALQEVIASGSKRLKKAAARVIYSRQHAHRPKAPPGPPTQSQRIRDGAEPSRYSSVAAVLHFALPEIRPYEEQDLTRRIAAVSIDYSLTRRRLVDEGWMTREAGQYVLTEQGETAWRVERFIATYYLR